MRRTHKLLLVGLVVLLSPLPALAATAEVTSATGPTKAYEIHRQGERDFANRHDGTSSSQ